MAEVKMESGNGDINDVSETYAKIIKQLEYYFSDINLGKDKFMKQEMMKNNGWIPLSVLMTFNRMKALTSSEEEIAAALRKSNSGLLLISENERQIKRDVDNHPLPELTDEYKKALNARTVHLKGFPFDAQYDDIHGFCSQYGEVESLEIRRTKEKSFKGCIFAVYKTEEEAEKAAKGEEKFKETHTLLRENKIRYFERKSEFYALREKNRRKAKKEAKDKEENEAMQGEMESHFVPNAVLKLMNVPENVGFPKIKDALNAFGSVRFVDIEDNASAFARFSNENGGEEALKKIQEKGAGDQLTIDENVVTVELLQGDEEKSYWQRISKIRSERKSHHRGDKSKGKKKGKKNHRLKYHKRGQKRSGEDSGEAPAKHVKVEAAD